MPITSSGYVKETPAQSRERIEQEVKNNLGEDAVVNKLGSPLSSIVNVEVEEAQTFDQSLGTAYSQLNVESATGKNLDYIGEQQGIPRIQSTFATVLVRFSGVSGTVIPSGFIVTSNNGISFQTLNQSIIATNNFTEIECQCLEYGDIGNLPIGSINVISNPIEGLENVINNVPSTGGGESETDEKYRERIKTNEGITIGNSNILTQQLLLLNGVSFVDYRENTSYNQSLDGLPPMSVQFLISGGLADDIWGVFKKYAAVPFSTYGEESVTNKNEFGRDITFKYSRPITINLIIQVSFVLLDNSLSDDFKDGFKQEIINFVNSRSAGINISGSEILAGITELFITNNQSEWNKIQKVIIKIKRENGSNYIDFLEFSFLEYPQVKEVIYG